MNVQCHACIGGTNVGEDIRKLDYGQHVVAGTPGRVFGKEMWEGVSPPAFRPELSHGNLLQLLLRLDLKSTKITRIVTPLM